jgi:predicted transport protein
MARDSDASFGAMETSLKEKTGKTLDEWVTMARASGLEKHGEIVKFLKEAHGITHGYANMIAHSLKQSAAALSDDRDAFIEQQYAGPKDALRPIYERLLQEILDFGDDIQVVPMKAYVSLRRGKQFAIIQPTTRTRVDVGLKLKGVAPSQRLNEGGFNGMVSHLVKVTGLDDIDAELVGWLREAYEGA